MRIVFLGTNGWYDTKTGNTICILVQTKNYDIILDCGNGIYKLPNYSDFNKPCYLFLSHFHLDHIIGFHITNDFPFYKGFYICSQVKSREILGMIIKQPFTLSFNDYKNPVTIFELPDEKNNIPFEVDVLPMHHSSFTLGFRLKLENKIITYCPDTGYCKNAVKLACDSDILITECAFKSGMDNPDWPHLNPETAAQIAIEAKAKKLVLVHFDAKLYNSLDDRIKAGDNAKKIFGNTIVAFDDEIIEVD